MSGARRPRASPWVQGGCAVTMAALAGFGALCSGLGTLGMLIESPGALLFATLLSTAVALPYLVVLLWVDRHEREPWWLVTGALAWGAIAATGLSAFGNDLFGAGLMGAGLSKDAAHALGASISAPLVEESTKGLALLALLALFRRHLHGVLDGVVYGALIGLGFEWLENIWYYVRQREDGASAMVGLAVARGVIGSPGTHAAWTALTGAAVGWWRANPGNGLRWLLVPCGWWMAVAGHFLWNTFARFSMIGVEEMDLHGVFAYGRAAVFLQTPSLLFLLLIVVLAWRHEDRLLRAALAAEPADVVSPDDAGHLLPARQRPLRVLAAWREHGLRAALRRRALTQTLIRLAFARWVHRTDAHDGSADEDEDVRLLRDEVRRLRHGGASV